jgi:hypothetical protein
MTSMDEPEPSARDLPPGRWPRAAARPPADWPYAAGLSGQPTDWPYATRPPADSPRATRPPTDWPYAGGTPVARPPRERAAHAARSPADYGPLYRPTETISPPVGPRSGHRRRKDTRLVSVIALIVLGLAGVAGGGAALTLSLTKKATKADIAAALAHEIATRWQRLPAGKLFPGDVRYQSAQGNSSTATRVGIAPAVPCQAALEPVLGQRFRNLGCVTMLRATYLDASGTLAATIGIAVMSSAANASKADAGLTPIKPSAGLHVVPFAGTMANNLSDADRGTAGADVSGPYVFIYTAGYTDGMPGTAAWKNPELESLGAGIVARLQTILTSHPNPCTMKDIRC